MDDKELIKAILHYQQCLEKYMRRNDEARVLYCLSKLYKMPVGIGHLQETGVGRTVNALRKQNGEIGEAAKALVGKWKEMVTADGENNDTKEASKSESTKHNDKHKTNREKSSSSHIESNKKKSRSNSVSEDDSKHSSKRAKEETKHRHHDSKDTRAKKDKHKSSKKIRDSSDESDEEENDYEGNNDSDRSRSTSEESDVKPEKKPKHSKNDNDENREYTKSKRKKYSENDESDDEVELIEKKKKSSKHSHEKKEKSKPEHKKDKRESETKSKKDDTKSREKHSSSSSSSTNKSNSKSDKKDKHRDSKSDKKSSKHSSSKNNDDAKKSKKSSQRGTMAENGIGSGSGASFAEALGMLMPSSSKTSKKKVAVIHPLTVEKPSTQSRDSSPEVDSLKMPELLSPKKLTPLDIKLDNLLPEITPNYRPLGFPIDAQMFKNKLSSEDETLSAIMYNKISRTKVYSGNKVAWGKVPSLFEICTRVLQDNIDALEYTGGVPYLILKPVIERANPDQLFMLEHHNPYLIEDTDELWQLHCNKEFRNKRREEMETWRDMYMRCLDEREAKLRALTANIKQSQDKSLPVRQTKLAYIDSFVKPPRNIARKQAKHGTGGVDKKPTVTPSSRLNALATSGAAGQISVPNPGTRAVSSSGSSTTVMKPKKAPLMQKTLALMKNRMFKR